MIDVSFKFVVILIIVFFVYFMIFLYNWVYCINFVCVWYLDFC